MSLQIRAGVSAIEDFFGLSVVAQLGYTVLHFTEVRIRCIVVIFGQQSNRDIGPIRLAYQPLQLTILFSWKSEPNAIRARYVQGRNSIADIIVNGASTMAGVVVRRDNWRLDSR